MKKSISIFLALVSFACRDAAQDSIVPDSMLNVTDMQPKTDQALDMKVVLYDTQVADTQVTDAQVTDAQVTDAQVSDWQAMPDWQGNDQAIVQDMTLDLSSDIGLPSPICLENCPNIEMIAIAPGTFSMGDANAEIDETPVHQVQIINGFLMSKSEITVGQYRACIEARWCTDPDYFSPDGNLKCTWHMPNDANLPVNCLNWHQARTFAKWMGGDLPSEAQWEYAAKSQGQDRKYAWGNADPSCMLANYWSETVPCNQQPDAPVGQAMAVCSLPAGNTEQGLCDMSGNLYEWMVDQSHPFYDGAPSDETPWCDQATCYLSMPADRVVRGGSWLTDANNLRNTNRYSYVDHFKYDNIGFRIVKPLN
jgi:formylglycine-generating enzyme required for sulfatase activity